MTITATKTKPKPARLSTVEKRAKAMCDAIKRGEHGGHITVEWKRSAMYGHNPSIEYDGSKVTNVSGCGYCKDSTALAEALRFLADNDDDMRKVWTTGGCGVSSTVAALDAIGWTLTCVASSKSSDSYTVARKG